MYRQARQVPDDTPIPENYSGNAFRYPPIGSLGAPLPPEEGEIPPERTDASEERLPLAVLPAERQEERRDGGEGGGGGLLRLLASEEWLLLGLCLLLLGEGGPRIGREGRLDDLLPYLLLLLFLG